MSLPQSDPAFTQLSGLAQPTTHSHGYIPAISLQDQSLQLILGQVQDLRTQLDRSQRLYEDSQRKQEGLTERLFTMQDKLVEAEKEVGELKATVERLSKVGPQIRLETPPSGGSSRMQSLAPSDSISQVPVLVPTRFEGATHSILPVRSSKRPQDLPFEVLWNLEDCRMDSDAAPQGSNASRPPMHLAIRKPNGTFISSEEYNSIRKCTAALVHTNLAYLDTPENNPLRRSRHFLTTKGLEKRSLSWYKTFYPARLAEVIEQLEGTHEELKLCSGHWKAEHMLMLHLNSSNATKQRKFSAIQNSDEEDKGNRKEKGKGKEKEKQRALSPSSDADSPPTSVLRRSSSPSSQITIDKSRSTQEPQHGKAPQLVMVNTMKRPRSDTLDTTTQAAKRLHIGDKDNEPSSAHNLIQSTFHIGLHQPASIDNSPGVGASTAPVDNEPSLEAQIDIGFIYVNPSLKTLNTIFANDFPLLKTTAMALISILTNLAASENNPPEPSNDVTAFISRIENADPNCPNLADDDNNAGWGHHQFTAGSQTVASVLTSWEAVGNVATACCLIAAAIKTCQVARYICLQRNIQATSYMSDAYLDRVVDTLTDLAHSQVPECPTNGPQVNVSASLRDGPADPTATSGSLAPSSATLTNNPKPPHRNALQALLVDDLKNWIRTHAISLPNRNAKKAELIDAILSSTHIPSKDEIQSLVSQRKGKKGTS